MTSCLLPGGNHYNLPSDLLPTMVDFSSPRPPVAPNCHHNDHHDVDHTTKQVGRHWAVFQGQQTIEPIDQKKSFSKKPKSVHAQGHRCTQTPPSPQGLKSVRLRRPNPKQKLLKTVSIPFQSGLASKHAVCFSMPLAILLAKKKKLLNPNRQTSYR